jgi:O-antigen ligase
MRDDDPLGPRSSLIWRSTALRLSLAAIPVLCTSSLLVQPTPWSIKLIVGGLAALSVASPEYGLLVIALLTPFGTLLRQILDVPFRMSEVLALAFLAGWLLPPRDDRSGPRIPPPMALAGWLLGLAIVSSIGVLILRLAPYPGELAETARLLRHGYFIFTERIGVVAGMQLAEGFALVVATVFCLRHRPAMAVWLPVALCAAGAAAAATSLLIWRGIGPSALVEHLSRLGYRVAHIGDLNAAGSYFSMLFCLALGMSFYAGGRQRLGWVALAVMNAVGLWFSESRSAFAATTIVILLALAWVITASWSRRARLTALVALLVLGAGASFVRARLLDRDPTFRGGGFRQQFNATSLRMIGERPLAGLGIGQYYSSSPLFLSPELALSYGVENAHNFYLQMAAELGIPGLLLFLSWVGGAMAPPLAVIGRPPARLRRFGESRRSESEGGKPDARLLGTTAGVLALLGTCLTGHPLLIHEVAFPFWIQLGLAVGLAESARMNERAGITTPRAVASAKPMGIVAAAAAAVIVLAAIVAAARGPVDPPSSRSVDGFYPWETTEDGRRFRWTERYASLFVPADVTYAYIPVRLPTDRPTVSPMGVEIITGGVEQSRTLIGNSWEVLGVKLPTLRPPNRFQRIDLKMDRTWQPGIYVPGSSDLRTVSIQVGEPELRR